MNVLIYGAGVIGQIYGGRLAAAGNTVTLLARGPAASLLVARGITLDDGGRPLRLRLRTVTEVPRDEKFDVIFVTVRRDQLAQALPDLATSTADRVVLLLNQCTGLERARAQVGANRTLFGFPGVGGQRTEDGEIRFLPIRQQPTTIERRAGREADVVGLLRAAGFAVQVSDDMDGWLKTHAVFITAVGGAILAAGGDSSALAADRTRVAALVAAVGEGFGALRRQDVTVTPGALRVIFTVVPRCAAVRYWRRQLRGPLGTMAIAPHVRASCDTEFPAMCRDVRALVAGHGPTPHLDRLLSADLSAEPDGRDGSPGPSGLPSR
jgi:2-dehydropantoate 2-reductase